MRTLQLLLFLAIFGYSLYSLITYGLRRGGNKAAFRKFKNRAKLLRHLSPDEMAAIQPFLYNPTKPRKPITLASTEVFELEGDYVQHGLTFSGGGTQMHDMIGGVDVVFPYDAQSFLAVHNKAEVVLTAGYVIVIRLNDGFDLLGARARALDRQQQAQRWNAGKAGELQNAPNEQAAIAEGTPYMTQTTVDSLRVEVLGQREETPHEMLARLTPGLGFVPAVPMVLAFAVLHVVIAADIGSASPYLLAVFVLCVSLAYWLFWRRPATIPKKVNRVRGALNLVEIQSASNSTVVSRQLFLGDKIAVNLPPHWRTFAVMPDDGKVEIEMRVDDHSVVRFGKFLSIDDEVHRLPQKFWGRHLTFASLGLLAALVVLALSGSIKSDVATTLAWIRGALPHTLSSAAQFNAKPPAFGALVTQHGGVLVRVLHGQHSYMPVQSEAQDDMTRLQRYSDWVTSNGVQTVEVTGAVVESRPDASSVPMLTIDASLGKPWPSLLRVTWLLFAIAMLSLHGLLAVINCRGAQLRMREITAKYAQCATAA